MFVLFIINIQMLPFYLWLININIQMLVLFIINIQNASVLLWLININIQMLVDLLLININIQILMLYLWLININIQTFVLFMIYRKTPVMSGCKPHTCSFNFTKGVISTCPTSSTFTAFDIHVFVGSMYLAYFYFIYL
jgi:hypothetical protein